mgnify:FL=1|jgi:hypothetical protein
MEEEIKDHGKYILNRIGIEFNDWSEIKNDEIDRNSLLSDSTYNNIKNDIIIVKKHFSSSTLTSLQNNAEKKQKWPLLNLVRQVLKIHGYTLTPKRKANGYTKTGQKLFRRFFIIEEI